MTGRAYFEDTIAAFLCRSDDAILGQLLRESVFAVEETQRRAWQQQLNLLRPALAPFTGRGTVYFEFSVPRLGKRIDSVVLIDNLVLVIEFKVGEAVIHSAAIDQVWDYAVDLKNFHETSHCVSIAPVLVATHTHPRAIVMTTSVQDDGVYQPVAISGSQIGETITQALAFSHGACIDANVWVRGGYRPTPTIIEAAMALYSGHNVSDISRNDASDINLSRTSAAIESVIGQAQAQKQKFICFVTGVPGAGKTLVGLNIATQHKTTSDDLHAVYLSGNGPLVAVLQEALARDSVAKHRAAGSRIKKGEALRAVASFIQNVHHYRDECLRDAARAPDEHIAIFDEAQRAWSLEQTASFMRRKKGYQDFDQSEPAFLISCLNRHKDWAVVVCLVGGGQEINTGEAGIEEWVKAVEQRFPDWQVHISDHLQNAEYGSGEWLERLRAKERVSINNDLHLSVSMRSFRAEHVSTWVKHMLDLDSEAAKQTFASVQNRYPIVLTRSVPAAKTWLKTQARGSERYGMVVSSQALRLKPHAIDVRVATDPVHWFLDNKDDVRSSYYLEDVATEFQVQGLELDWACVVWDADFRYTLNGWTHHSFVGSRWQNIHKADRQSFLKNAYRVLLTRARQGMVIVVPEGDEIDKTRTHSFYDSTFDYLSALGIPLIH